MTRGDADRYDVLARLTAEVEYALGFPPGTMQMAPCLPRRVPRWLRAQRPPSLAMVALRMLLGGHPVCAVAVLLVPSLRRMAYWRIRDPMPEARLLSGDVAAVVRHELRAPLPWPCAPRPPVWARDVPTPDPPGVRMMCVGVLGDARLAELRGDAPIAMPVPGPGVARRG